MHGSAFEVLSIREFSTTVFKLHERRCRIFGLIMQM